MTCVTNILVLSTRNADVTLELNKLIASLLDGRGYEVISDKGFQKCLSRVNVFGTFVPMCVTTLDLFLSA
jgi:phosphoenolpyruvate carboxylase